MVGHQLLCGWVRVALVLGSGASLFLQGEGGQLDEAQWDDIEANFNEMTLTKPSLLADRLGTTQPTI